MDVQVFTILAAIVAGTVVQWLLAYRQTRSFTRASAELRNHGRVAVGAGGRRYRGGRSYVAIAADENGRVVRAVCLSGWSTFARPRRMRALEGLRVNTLCGERPLDDLSPTERLAARQAGEFARRAVDASPSLASPGGSTLTARSPRERTVEPSDRGGPR